MREIAQLTQVPRMSIDRPLEITPQGTADPEQAAANAGVAKRTVDE